MEDEIMVQMQSPQDPDVFNLYKYQSKIGRLKDFLNQQLWMSSLEGFNDPFEGVFTLMSNPRNLKPGTAIFDHHYQYHQMHVNPNATPEQYLELVNMPKFNQALSENKMFVRNFFPNHGAFCFASSRSNIPMWAHYANEHQGYCVTFELNFSDIFKLLPDYSKEDAKKYKEAVLDGSDVLSFHSKLDEEIKFIITKVRYLQEAPEIYLDQFMELKNDFQAVRYIIQHSVGVKFKQWDYEDEFRLIVNANSAGSNGLLMDLQIYAPFLKVTGVIMGAKMSEDDKNECRTLCSNYNLRLHQAKCSEKKYEISIELVEDYSLVKVA